MFLAKADCYNKMREITMTIFPPENEKEVLVREREYLNKTERSEFLWVFGLKYSSCFPPSQIELAQYMKNRYGGYIFHIALSEKHGLAFLNKLNE